MSAITIRNGLVVTQDQKRRVAKANIVIRDSEIESVGNESDTSDVVIDADDKIVIPGLINTHTHVGMSILRGLVTNDNLETFLKKTVEFDAKNTADAIDASTKIAAFEMLRSGTTSFLDLYYSEDVIAESLSGTGMRAFLSWVALDEEFTTQKGVPIKNAERFVKAYKGKDLVTPSFGLQGVYVCSKETTAQAFELADKYDTVVHMHLAETKKEVDDHAKKSGMRPVEWMSKNGFMRDRLVAAHCVWLNDSELSAFAKNGANVSHNPISNSNLHSGTADVKKMMSQKVNVTLGTDSLASNNTLDIFENMRFAAKLNGLSAQEVLDMTTINAGKALRSNIGSVEKGKKADIVLVDRKGVLADVSKPAEVINGLVDSVDLRSINKVIVDGNIILDTGWPLSDKFNVPPAKLNALVESFAGDLR